MDKRLQTQRASLRGRSLCACLISGLAWGGILLAGVGSASASTQATGFYIDGAGFGHGVGMSQYGAAGYAEHGFGYKQILTHYYEGTTLGQISPSHRVRVLLRRGAASFQGADTQLGPKTRLKPDLTYSVRPTSKGLLLSAGGRRYGVWGSPLIVRGRAPLDVPGMGRYRGSLEFVRSGSHVDTINEVGIEDYVRGVVAAEMPPGWPAQALEAQAVAARTFAVATGAANKLFNVYDDTRSQVYRGVSAETPSSDAAVAATTGQVVEHGGAPAITYFFSSSGGHTESVQNVWQGVEPEAWLRGVPDPYDDSFNNPYYRWKQTLSVGTASGDLRHYLKGDLKGIEVLRHGASPRIVKAAVVGSKGTVDVTGTQLETAFGLRSTYASFTTITSRGVVDSGSGSRAASHAPTAAPGTATVPAGSGGAGVMPSVPKTVTSTSPTGRSAVAPSGGSATSALTGIVHTDVATAGTADASDFPLDAVDDLMTAAAALPLLTWKPSPTWDPSLTVTAAHDLRLAAHRRSPRRAVQGSAYPAAPGTVIHVERAVGRAWRTVGSGRVTVAGTYAVRVDSLGMYRVVLNGIDGPSIKVG
jgi:stage II sporulation protein D